jgi:hypothetical protein
MTACPATGGRRAPSPGDRWLVWEPRCVSACRDSAVRSMPPRWPRRYCVSPVLTRGLGRSRVRSSGTGAGQPASMFRTARPRHAVRGATWLGYAGEEMLRQAPGRLVVMAPRHTCGFRAAMLRLRMPGRRGPRVRSRSRWWRHHRGGKHPRSGEDATNDKRAPASVMRHSCRRGKTFGGCSVGRSLRASHSLPARAWLR